jgi:hypothetical protein
MVDAQRNRTDKLLGSAADTLPIQHPVAQITKSLLQAAPCGVKGENMQTILGTFLLEFIYLGVGVVSLT